MVLIFSRGQIMNIIPSLPLVVLADTARTQWKRELDREVSRKYLCSSVH